MWSLVVACALACGGSGANDTAPPLPPAVVSELSENLQTGSLIFSRGDCLTVKVFSRSPYTHVGGVVLKDGVASVYDSMYGVGVRVTPLAEYLREQAPSTVEVVHPVTPFTPAEAAAYSQHLHRQLGRPYSVTHHLTGLQCRGVHCAEFMTEALMSAELISASRPSRVSPGSLLEGLLVGKIYSCGDSAQLPATTAPRSNGDAEQQETWYQRAWRNTTAFGSKRTDRAH